MWWLLLLPVVVVVSGFFFLGDPLPGLLTRAGDITVNAMVVQCGNVPQGTKVNILANASEMTITSNGFTKKIPFENVIEATVGLADQISIGKGFSVGKAIVGTALIGGIGAIAGLSKKHNYTPKTMIISFMENNETNYMVFLQEMAQNGKIEKLKTNGDLILVACSRMTILKNKNKNI